MSRLPQPGSDGGVWGDVLNDYLLQTHDLTGQLRSDIVTEANLTPAARTKLNAYTTKVDAASLATVATTGSYTDLTNKPAIPTITLSATAPSNPTTGDMWVDLSS